MVTSMNASCGVQYPSIFLIGSLGESMKYSDCKSLISYRFQSFRRYCRIRLFRMFIHPLLSGGIGMHTVALCRQALDLANMLVKLPTFVIRDYLDRRFVRSDLTSHCYMNRSGGLLLHRLKHSIRGTSFH